MALVETTQKWLVDHRELMMVLLKAVASALALTLKGSKLIRCRGLQVQTQARVKHLARKEATIKYMWETSTQTSRTTS